MTQTIIRVSDYSEEVFKIAERFDLVLLDLDDVVITTSQYFCSSQWYHKYLDKNREILPIEDIVYNIYNCMEKTEFIVVSQDLIKNFSRLAQEKNVFALTARRISFADNTDEHLKKVNMIFSNLLLDHELVQNGVIYSGFKPNSPEAEDKGITLKKLIDQGVFGEIKTVLLIDDLLKNLQRVEEAFANSDIEFLGIHFTNIRDNLDAQFSERDLEIIGDSQHKHFNLYGRFIDNYKALDVGGEF